MYTAKQMIVVRRDLHMRKGKIAAQAGHACVTAILKALQRDGLLSCIHIEENGAITLPEDLPETPLTAWFTRGEAKICVYVDSEEELLALDQKAREADVTTALILDAGFTEFHGQPTYTALAFEPLEAERADELTGGLPLY